MGDGNGTEIVVSGSRSLTPMELLQSALERGADMSILEKLMDLQERHERNAARRAFDEAIANAKAKIPPIRKNRHVGFDSKNGGAKTDYKHEDMAEIAKVVTPILSEFGLSYRFRTHYEPGQPVMVTCIVSHRLGHAEENTLPGPPDSSGNKNSLQAIGSTVTYLQRYTLKSALGLSSEHDDDGRAAGGAEAINAEQAQELRELADKGGTDLEKFCAFMRVEDIPSIRQKDFERAKIALQAKAKAKEKVEKAKRSAE